MPRRRPLAAALALGAGLAALAAGVAPATLGSAAPASATPGSARVR